MDSLVNRVMTAIDKDGGDIWKEFDDPPPSSFREAGFWTWQTICWIYYGFVTIVYIPWAFAWHLIIGILALLVGCMPIWWRSSRKPFVFVYVLTVLLPGKYVWYNIFRHTRRRGQVWDFEMAKPRPVPMQKRRRLSDTSLVKPQSTSPLFTKLPPEIRLRIYKHVIVDDTEFLTIMEPQTIKNRKERKDPVDRRSRVYPCYLFDYENEDLTLESKIRSLHQCPTLRVPVDHQSMGLHLLQTCRKAYTEAIDLFYSLPVFNFRDLHRPPFFLRTVMPHRLVNIRSVHIVYDQHQIKKTSHIACSTAKFYHQIGECRFCNPIQWLNGIKKHMPNLKHFEAYLFLQKEQRLPTMGDTWIHRMLDLQVGPNGLRQMRIDVSPKKAHADLTVVAMLEEGAYVKKVRRLNKELQKRLRTGVERYIAQQTQQSSLEGDNPPPTIIVPPPRAHSQPTGDEESTSSEMS